MRLGLGQAELLAAGNMQDLPAEPAVAQQPVHMIVASDEPLLLLFPVEGGTMGMERGIDRVRVAVEGRVAAVERHMAGGWIDLEEGRYHHGQRLSGFAKPRKDGR